MLHNITTCQVSLHKRRNEGYFCPTWYLDKYLALFIEVNLAAYFDVLGIEHDIVVGVQGTCKCTW